MRQAGADVRAFDDLFPQATPDVEWLTAVGQQRWVVLTRDRHIRYNKVERAALFAASVQCFTLTSSGVTGDEAAEILVSALSRMSNLCARRRGRPFIAKVSRGPVVAIVAEKP